MEIAGIGGTLDISKENVIKQLDKEGANQGKFIDFYEMDWGANQDAFLGSSKLEGRLYEFENLFWVAWSCGEYIDIAVFPKDQDN